MSRSIYVQAQADHIESLSKATPITAIEELVWNALDADAHQVLIDVVTNPLGGVEAIRISDDGTGIDVLRADSTFGSLGGSWKRADNAATGAGCRLHGRRGCGRFKAFALGSTVEWRTTVRIGNELLSYVIRGNASEPGVFELDASPSPGPGTGTEVYVSGARANCDMFLDAAEIVQSLAAKFALYLKSYPDVRIFFCGLPVTPLVMQRSVTDVRLNVSEGAYARLEIIEWRRKFAGTGKIVLSGNDGFQLHEVPAGVRSGGTSFTAYLVSPRFPALNAENSLIMDDLNPEVRMYLDAAKAALREHFSQKGRDRDAAQIESWREDGSYPFEDGEESAERGRFDKLAVELAGRVSALADATPEDRSVLFKLLRSAMRSVPKGGLKELLK